MRRRDYRGALRVVDGFLSLVSLRAAEEVVEADRLEPPSGRELTPQERRMAQELVDALAGPFEPGELRDDYRERVLELVRIKAEGGKVERRTVEKKTAEGSLTEALEASLAEAAGG